MKKPYVFWTEREDRLLKKYFLDLPWDKLLDIFGGKRTRTAITQRAVKQLRLYRVDPRKVPYSDQEIKIIRRYYGVLSPEKLKKMLPGRIWPAIRLFALTKLGMSRAHLRSWSAKELEILYQHYSSSPWPLLLRLLPNRTRSAICLKSDKLGLKRGDSFFWSEEHKQSLLRAIEDSSKVKSRKEFDALVENLIKKIGRSYCAIQYKMRRERLEWGYESKNPSVAHRASIASLAKGENLPKPKSLWKP